MSDEAVTERNTTVHYRGDRRTMVGSTAGPNLSGEFWLATSASFDESTARAAVTFSPIEHPTQADVHASLVRARLG